MKYPSALAGHAGMAERHQHLAIGTELNDDVALAVLALAVGDIDVALFVEREPVRKDEHPGAKAGEQIAVRVEMQHRRQIRVFQAIPAAALERPDALAVDPRRDGDDPAHTDWFAGNSPNLTPVA